jgi:hypothetical protein
MRGAGSVLREASARPSREVPTTRLPQRRRSLEEAKGRRHATSSAPGGPPTGSTTLLASSWPNVEPTASVWRASALSWSRRHMCGWLRTSLLTLARAYDALPNVVAARARYTGRPTRIAVGSPRASVRGRPARSSSRSRPPSGRADARAPLPIPTGFEPAYGHDDQRADRVRASTGAERAGTGDVAADGPKRGQGAVGQDRALTGDANGPTGLDCGRA